MTDTKQPPTIQASLERAMYDIWEEHGDVPTGFSLSPRLFQQFILSLGPLQWDYRTSDHDTIIWQSSVGTFKVTRDWNPQPH